MSNRMKWNKPHSLETEAKYAAGTTLRNGTVVRRQLDGLAARAQKAEREWLKANRMTSIFARPPKKRKKQKKKKPFFDRSKLFDDVVMTTLNEMGREGRNG